MTMPLDEVPANIRRSHSTNRTATKSIHHGDPIAPQTQPPPLAVQGMLRSVTELGDVGIFAQRPSRVPRPTTQSSLDFHPRSSSGSHISRYQQKCFKPAVLGHQRSYGGSTHELRRNDTVQSNLSSYQDWPRSRRLLSRSGSYVPNQRPRLPGENRALHSHRSLTSLRSHNGTINHPPLSPRSFRMTRAHRSGRVPSPATINMYVYRHHSRQSHLGNRSSSGTAASSPISRMSAVRRIQDYRNQYNASAWSLRPPASPAAGFRSYQRRGYLPYARSTTSAAGLPAVGRVYSTNSLFSGPTSPTDSIVPLYYDYSESFHGRAPLLQFVDGQEQMQGARPGSPLPAAQSPFGTLPGSRFLPIELPTQHNRRASEVSSRSRHSRNVSERTNRTSPAVIAETADVDRPQEGGQEDLPHGPHMVQPSTDVTYPSGNPSARNSITSSQKRLSQSDSTFFTNASRSPRNLSNLAARAHSPSTGDLLEAVRSIDAVAVGSETPKQPDRGLPKGKTASDQDVQTTTFNSKTLSKDISRDLRPRTSPTPPTYHTPEIVSPRPERPTSSQSRKRFSKILDVDQQQTATEAYNSCRMIASHSFTRLERVDEVSSPVKAPAVVTTSMASRGENFSTTSHYSSASVDNASRGRLPSHDVSTVDSLLERHIECLGLIPGQELVSQTLTDDRDNAGQDGAKGETTSTSRTATMEDVVPYEIMHSTSGTHQPSSLSSCAQKRLMPRRLFASMDSKLPNCPTTIFRSDTRLPLSLARHGNITQHSHGWLTLPSESYLSTDIERSRETLLSGDYADIESSRSVEKFRIRRSSSPDATPIPLKQDHTEMTKPDDYDGHGALCHRSTSNLNSSETSRRRRKMKIHLKNLASNSNTTLKGSDDTVDAVLQEYERGLATTGLSQNPISTVDGFAELSAESTSAAQSLTSILNIPDQPKSDMWQNSVAVIPTMGKRTTGLRRKPSASTIRTVRSDRNVLEPLNTSRVTSKRASREINRQSSVPQLAYPDLGPTMRASEFDLSTQYLKTSPQPKTSSPIPMIAKSPEKYGKHSMRARWKCNSLRHIMSKPLHSRGAANTHFNMTISQDCRLQPAVSFDEQPMYPDTIAMSDFAYRKYRVMEKLKEWCRGPCMSRPVAVKRKSSIAGGFLVD